MTQRELKQRIMDDPDLTRDEKAKLLNALRAPYVKMSDEELLQLVRDFTREHGREPTQRDVIYDRELKARFGTLEPHARARRYPADRRALSGEKGKAQRESAHVTRNTAGSFESSKRRRALPQSKEWSNQPCRQTRKEDI